MLTISPEELRGILKDYEYDDDIMCDDDPRVRVIKYRMSHLPDYDRILFCLYLHFSSSRKLGKLLGVSHSSVLKEIHRIKTVLLDFNR